MPREIPVAYGGMQFAPLRRVSDSPSSPSLLVLFLVAASMALSSTASASRLPKAPKKQALSKSSLVRPLQRAFGKIKYDKTKGASRLSLYKFNKASKSLELRLTFFKEKRADGSSIESIRLRVPSAERMTTKEFHSGKLKLRRFAELALGSDVHYSLLTRADGSSKTFFRGQLSDEIYSSTTESLVGGEKRTTHQFSQILNTQQHALKKSHITRHHELTHRLKALRSELGNDAK